MNLSSRTIVLVKMKSIAVLLFLSVAVSASADNATSKKRYAAGVALYDAARYEAALREFEAAQAAEAHAGLIYNIAKCLDHLERRAEAKAAYERFLAAPDHQSDPETDTLVKERLTALTEVAAPPLSPPPTASPPVPSLVLQTPPTPSPAPIAKRRSRYLTPGIVGGSALALAAIGAGLTGSALAGYEQLSVTCAPDCNAATWQGLPAREHAGEALLGIASAVVVADVIWFIIESRKRP